MANPAVKCPTEDGRIRLRGKRLIAVLILAGVLLAGFAALGLRHIYLNHIVRDCGADCVPPSSGETVQRGV